MIKKALAIIVCLSLVLSCVLVQADETISKNYNGEIFKVLKAIGVADYENTELNATITRGEFYELLCKVSGYPATENNTQVFTDLIPGNPAEPYAKTLYKVGIIAPDNGGNVYPDAAISANEAVSRSVRVLGY